MWMASNNKRGSKYTCWPFCCFLFAPLCIVVYLEPAAAAAARMVAYYMAMQCVRWRNNLAARSALSWKGVSVCYCILPAGKVL